MESIVKAALVRNIKDIEVFNIKVTEKNSEIVKLKLTSERNKIVKILQDLKRQEVIKSIFRPKNKTLQKDLDNLIKIKQDLKKSIEKINVIY